MRFESSKPKKGKTLKDSAQKMTIEATVEGDDEVLAALFYLLFEEGAHGLAIGIRHVNDERAKIEAKKEPTK